jgi:hypothetical protein
MMMRNEFRARAHRMSAPSGADLVLSMDAVSEPPSLLLIVRAGCEARRRRPWTARGAHGVQTKARRDTVTGDNA